MKIGSNVESRVSHFLAEGAHMDLRYGYDIAGRHETYELEREDIALLLEDHRMLAAIRGCVEEWGAWDNAEAVVRRVLEIVRRRGDAL